MKEYQKIAAGVPGKGHPTMTDFVRPTELLSEKRTLAPKYNKVATMVVLDLHSYSVVEDSGFRELFAAIVPNYHLTSCSTLSHVLVLRM